MNYYINKLYALLERDRVEYLRFIKEQIKFFESFYIKYILKNPKLSKQAAEIIKNLKKEYNANTRHKQSGNTNKQPIVWHKTRTSDKN